MVNFTIPQSAKAFGECGCTALWYILDNTIYFRGVGSITGCLSNELMHYGVSHVEIGEGITSIGNGMFQYCSSLISVTFPDSIAEIGAGAFYKCLGVKDIIVPKCVSVIGELAFGGVEHIHYEGPLFSLDNWGALNWDPVCIPSGSCGKSATWRLTGDTICIKGTGWITSPMYPITQKLTPKRIVIHEGITGIGEHVFENITGIPEIVLPTSVKEIAASAFKDCADLVSLHIPNSVTKIGANAFKGIKRIVYEGSLYSLDNWGALNWDVKCNPNGQCGCNAFWNLDRETIRIEGEGAIDTRLTSAIAALPVKHIVIEEGITEIKSHIFEECHNIISVIIPDSVIFIGEAAFRNCTALAMIRMPKQVRIVNKAAFQNIQNICYDDIAYHPQNKGESDFKSESHPYGSCGEHSAWYVVDDTLHIWGTGKISYPMKDIVIKTKVNRVVIEEGITCIGEKVFSNCRLNSTVVIPKSVRQIEDGAFIHSINKLIIPPSVEYIGHNAFLDVATVVYNGNAYDSCNWGACMLNGTSTYSKVFPIDLLVPEYDTWGSRYFGWYTCSDQVQRNADNLWFDHESLNPLAQLPNPGGIYLISGIPACTNKGITLFYCFDDLDEVICAGKLSDAAIVQAKIVAESHKIDFDYEASSNWIACTKIQVENVIMLRDIWCTLPESKAYCSESDLNYSRLLADLEIVFEDNEWIVYSGHEEGGCEYNVIYKDPKGQPHLVLYYVDHEYINDGHELSIGNIVCRK